VGSLNSTAGKGTDCQVLSTTTGGHRTLLAGTRSCRGATLYRHLSTSAAITTAEVTGKTLLLSRDLCIASSPRSLLHYGNDLLFLSSYKASRISSTFALRPFHLAPGQIDDENRVRDCGILGTRSWRRLRTGRPEQHLLGSSQSPLPLNRQTCFDLETRVSPGFLDNASYRTWIIHDFYI
jgi:hypothetical protein